MASLAPRRIAKRLTEVLAAGDVDHGRSWSAKPSFVDLIVDMHLPPVFRSRLEDTLRDLQARPRHGPPCLDQRRGRFHLTTAFSRFRVFAHFSHLLCGYLSGQ